MTQLKELYKGKCLDDLRSYFKIPETKNFKLKLVINSTQKVHEEAEKFLKEGDEEMSYIHFMKYFSLLEKIRSSPDYAQQKSHYTNIIGGQSKVTAAIDKAEELSKSLKKRYAQLAERERTERERAKTKIVQVEQDVTNNNKKNLLNNDYRLGKNNYEDFKNITSISCPDLYKMTQNPNSSILIMDCRPKADFLNSKLKYECCVNVPEEIILPGMSAGKIQQQLDKDSQKVWSSRVIKDQVILMDWKSKGPEPALHSPIWRLRDILQNFDIDAKYEIPIQVLAGGYEEFILLYPFSCTNPKVQAPQPIMDDRFFEEIEYPSINDIIMKDEIIYEDSNRFEPPSVDRKAKVLAVKTYEEKNKLQLLEKQQQLLEKAVKSGRECLETKKTLNNIINEAEKSKSKEEEIKISKREKELIYKLMQLESDERDYKLENERLRRQLEEYQRREKENGEKISEKEAENLEKVAKVVQVKIEERKQIDEELKKYPQESDKLVIAREQKRHLKPPTEEDSISKPKIPQFDRSTKPFIKNEYSFEEKIQRDFSPVPGPVDRGLTGLKNLGNTCYMNSIMQCLSNTTELCDYFITRTYRKHINRSNKTKGQIVEEVAALIEALWSGHHRCVASKDLRFVVGQYQQIFRGVEQQDSHEFLTILMDWLHSDLQTIRIEPSPRDNISASEKAWLEFTKSCESFILRLFYGQIKSTVKCAECQKESATYECFSNLSLELPTSSNRCALRDCLKLYFNGERIRGWNCPNCKEKRDAVKKLDISKLPPILVVHFKRFYADPDSIGTTYKKKQNYINFPLTDLDMTPYIAPSEIRSSTRSHDPYYLYGVSNHYGSMEGGHYTAFCKSNAFQKWFKFDDQVVTQLDRTNVISSAAYILFYTNLPRSQFLDT